MLTASADELLLGASFMIQISRTSSASECNVDDLLGDIYNIASVTASNEANGATGNNTDDAGIDVLCPDITVEKSASDLPIDAGDTASFTIVVSNDGDDAAGTAYDVSLTDTLPGLGWSIDWEITDNDTASIDVVDGEEVLTASAETLALGASFTITVFRLTNLDDCGDIYNVADVAGSNEPDGATGNNSDSATVQVDCPVGGGLTPGYWKNWRNHYAWTEEGDVTTSTEFAILLQDTVADVGTDEENIARADEIFADYNNNDPASGEMLEVFILANELTINLTVWNFENPDDLLFMETGIAMYGAVEITHELVDYNLGEVLFAANAYLVSITPEVDDPYIPAYGDPLIAENDNPSDAHVTALKTILDLFANLNNS